MVRQIKLLITLPRCDSSAIKRLQKKFDIYATEKENAFFRHYTPKKHVTAVE
jgi:hypothetical protein